MALLCIFSLNSPLEKRSRMCGRIVFLIVRGRPSLFANGRSSLSAASCGRLSRSTESTSIPRTAFSKSNSPTRLYRHLWPQVLLLRRRRRASQSPTLRVKTGDEVVLKLKNDIPAGRRRVHALHDMEVHGPCGSGKMTASTTNLHFHGFEAFRQAVIKTEGASDIGPAFRIRMQTLFNRLASQTPGLYWYHPHPHGFSEAQVLGGASGALIVERNRARKPQSRRLAGTSDRFARPNQRGSHREAGDGRPQGL